MNHIAFLLFLLASVFGSTRAYAEPSVEQPISNQRVDVEHVGHWIYEAEHVGQW